MNRKLQHDLFLLLTIMGTFLTLLLFVFGGAYAFQARPGIAAELVQGDWTALSTRARQAFPIWVDGNLILISTLFSYWRYHKLTLPK